MPIRYELKQGETIIGLSDRFGLFAETIWNAPENADLRSRRADPNALMPGDVVVIPDKRTDVVVRPVDQRHVFRRIGIPAKLRLRLAINDRPRANLPYRMTLDAAEGERTGVTDAEGVLELFIPASARVATLWIDDDPTPVRLAVGHMDPAEEWSGVGKRLANLGYLASPSAIPGAGEGPPPRLVRALREFQEAAELQPTGELDEPTRAALVEAHDRLGRQP